MKITLRQLRCMIQERIDPAPHPILLRDIKFVWPSMKLPKTDPTQQAYYVVENREHFEMWKELFEIKWPSAAFQLKPTGHNTWEVIYPPEYTYQWNLDPKPARVKWHDISKKVVSESPDPVLQWQRDGLDKYIRTRDGTYYWLPQLGELTFVSNKNGRVSKLSKRVDPWRKGNSFHNLRDEDAALARVRKHMAMTDRRKKR